MISIIICSINKIYLKNISENIENSIGIKFEIIAIDNRENRYSIAQAYNLGAKKAKFEILCFIHEDLIFHTKDWGVLLNLHFKKENVRAIGVLGCTVKTKSPSSVYVYNSDLNRQNQLQRYPNGNLILRYENPLNESFSYVCIIDGLFIATKKKFWEETKFSEDYLTGFHGYDIDFSLKNHLLGNVIVVYDILIEHFSFGNFRNDWIEAQLLLTQKWKKSLPLSTNKTSGIKDAEKSNSAELLKLMIRNNYGKLQLVKHLLTYIIENPFDRLNIFFLRKVILGQNLDMILKKTILKLR